MYLALDLGRDCTGWTRLPCGNCFRFLDAGSISSLLASSSSSNINITSTTFITTLLSLSIQSVNNCLRYQQPLHWHYNTTSQLAYTHSTTASSTSTDIREYMMSGALPASEDSPDRPENAGDAARRPSVVARAARKLSEIFGHRKDSAISPQDLDRAVQRLEASQRDDDCDAPAEEGTARGHS